MWLFTRCGFFSVVTADRRKGEAPQLMVRARVADDLHALRLKYAPDLGPTLQHTGTDYPYRALITREGWAAAMSAIALDLDYRNFKSEVDKRQGVERHRLYAKVWGVMYDAEAKLGQQAGRPSKTRAV
jgi:hypothetical protein